MKKAILILLILLAFSCSKDEEEQIVVTIKNARLAVEVNENNVGSLTVFATITGDPKDVKVKLSSSEFESSRYYGMEKTGTNTYQLTISIFPHNYSGTVQGEIVVSESTLLTNAVTIEWKVQVSRIEFDVSETVILANNLNSSFLDIRFFDKNDNEISEVDYEVYDTGKKIVLGTKEYVTDEIGFHNLSIKHENITSNEKRIDAINPNYEFEIPVIFHIVHFGEAVGKGNNLPLDYINFLLQKLNEGFSNAFGSTNPYAVNTKISFRLARYDSNNALLSEPGVNRIDGRPYDVGTKGDTPNDGKFGEHESREIARDYYWERTEYLNLMTLDMQKYGGVCSYPSVLVSQPLEGISTGTTDSESNRVNICTIDVDVDAFFNSGSANYKALIHEVGHAFGLLHVFSDDGCETSDYCPDTYSYNREDENNPRGSPCSDNISGEVYDNFMDYGGSKNTFSKDQRGRMRHVLKYGVWFNELKYSER